MYCEVKGCKNEAHWKYHKPLGNIKYLCNKHYSRLSKHKKGYGEVL